MIIDSTCTVTENRLNECQALKRSFFRRNSRRLVKVFEKLEVKEYLEAEGRENEIGLSYIMFSRDGETIAVLTI